MCGAKALAISFIDEGRQWVKSCFGGNLSEIPRSISLCGHVINNDPGEILEIQETASDDRFQDNPLVEKYEIFSYYAGIPIIDKEGFALGSLCVIDEKPKKLNEHQRESLRVIAQLVTDQLELHKTKIEVTRKDERLMDILNSVDDAIYELDAEGHYLFVNAKTCEMLGLSEQQLKEKKAFEFVHPEDLQEVVKYHQTLFAKGETSGYYEMRIIPLGKNPMRIGQKVSLDYQDGELLRIRAIAREFSEIRMLRQALQDRENQYKVLSENSRDVIGVHGVDGAYKYISQAAQVEMGYDPKDVLGKAPRDFIHPKDLQSNRGKLSVLFNGEVQVTNFECRIKKNDGEYIWMEVYARVINDEKGEVAGFHSSARDISERKRNEDKVSLLIESTTDAVWAVDKDLRLIYFNSVFKNLHLQRTGNMVRIGARLQPDRVGASFEDELTFIKKALRGIKSTQEVRFDIRGQLYVMDNSATPIFNEADKVTGVSVFSRNITEQYQEKQRLFNYQVGLRLLNDLAVNSLPTEDLLNEALLSICSYLKMPVGLITMISDHSYEVKYHSDASGLLSCNLSEKLSIENTYSGLTFQKQVSSTYR